MRIKRKKKASCKLSKNLGYHPEDFELGEQQDYNMNVLKNYTVKIKKNRIR